MSVKEGTKFTYGGKGYLAKDDNAESFEDMPTVLPEQEYTVDEYFPYEPSAYVWEPQVIAHGADGKFYLIMDADVMIYQGYCPDCGHTHDDKPINCPMGRMD